MVPGTNLLTHLPIFNYPINLQIDQIRTIYKNFLELKRYSSRNM